MNGPGRCSINLDVGISCFNLEPSYIVEAAVQQEAVNSGQFGGKLCNEACLRTPSFSFSFRKNKFRIIRKSRFRTRDWNDRKFIFLFIIIIINRSKHTVIISSILLIGSISGYTVRKEREKVSKLLSALPLEKNENIYLSVSF